MNEDICVVRRPLESIMSLAENLDNHFRQKHDLPDEFKFFRWVCMPLDGPTIYYEVEGGIVNSMYRSGPRKGRPNHSKSTNRQTFRMTVEEYDRLLPKVAS